jgi:hypothetical protein
MRKIDYLLRLRDNLYRHFHEGDTACIRISGGRNALAMEGFGNRGLMERVTVMEDFTEWFGAVFQREKTTFEEQENGDILIKYTRVKK